MTLNDFELCNGIRYFTEFCRFGANYVKVVEDRPMRSANKISPKNLVISNV